MLWRALLGMVGPLGRPLTRPLVDAWRRGADVLLPRQCALCDDWLGADEYGLCMGCLQALPGRLSRRCPGCAIRLEADGAPGPPPRCAVCLESPSGLDHALALCDYAAPIDRALIAGKFRGQTSVLHRLGEALAASLAMAPDLERLRPAAGLVMPVPLSDQRLTERGYNQAAILARVLARRLALPCRPHALRRTRHTASQSALNRMDREANLRGAFACRIDVAGRTVVLVDDVMTTGATLQAAAGCLRAAGAVGVIGLVIARTPAPRVPARSA